MAAAYYELKIDEGRDNSLELRWLDRKDDPINVSDYGALAEIRDSDGNLISRITSGDGDIVLRTDGGTPPADPEDSLEGIIHLTFPATDLHNLNEAVGEWELVLFPVAANQDNPISLLRGPVVLRKKITELNAD